MNHIFFTFKKQFTNMKIYKIRHLWALALMLGVAGHFGCSTDEIGPTIKIPCWGDTSIDACQRKIVFSNEKVSAVYCSSPSSSESERCFLFVSLSQTMTTPITNLFRSNQFIVCNPEKIKDIVFKQAKNYADGEKYIFRVNLREPCDDGNILTALPLHYHAEIISVESVPNTSK
jgi:hypothetical protein